MRGEHVYLRRLFDCLYQTESLVHSLACAVDSVHSPDNEAELFHLFRSRFADAVRAAEHPRQNADSVRENDDALGAHLPKSVGYLLLVKLVYIVHRERVRRVAVHDDSVLRVNAESRHVAHQVSGQLACESAAVGVAPEQLGGRAVLGDSYDSEIVLWVELNVLEVFARSGDDEYLADKRLRVKPGRDSSDNFCEVEIFADFLFVEHIAYVAAVSLVPAEAVHVGCSLHHFLHKGRSQNVFHFLASSVFFS